MLTFSITACKKNTYTTDINASLRLSEDTLFFDTVFVTQGSTTQFLKIFNENNEGLKISKIELAGGANSMFKINVDGISNHTFANIEIEKNDSIYLFATVNVNPRNATLPFLIRDSVKIEWNGNTKWLQLEAYGKNARFMRNVVVTKDSNISNELPIVILGSLFVAEGKTLTINKGAQLYVHANAPIIIDGSLKCIGDTGKDRIIFRGIRIDEPYIDFPGSWPGIYFTSKSTNNYLEQCEIKNAYRGAIVLGKTTSPKLTLNSCVLDNIYDIALLGSEGNIKADNCLISNVGYGLFTIGGGTYNFNYCTFASINNFYLSHKNPLINLSNTSEDNSINGALICNINNSIIYGDGGFVENEVVITKINNNNTLTANLTNCLVKQKNFSSQNILTNDILLNQNPQFDSINLNKRIFNFRLKNNSPCIDFANTSNNLDFDLNKNQRPKGIRNDIGCYENQ